MLSEKKKLDGRGSPGADHHIIETKIDVANLRGIQNNSLERLVQNPESFHEMVPAHANLNLSVNEKQKIIGVTDDNIRQEMAA